MSTARSHAAPTSLSAPAPGVAIRGPVLLATDGRGETDAAALAARRLARRLGAPVEVLAVLEPPPAYTIGYEVAPLPPAPDASRVADLAATVRRRLGPVLGPAHGPPDGWRLELRLGAPARTIAEVARERGAALVVVGLGRRRVVDRLLGEEVALQVVRRASTPVLAVAPELDGPIHRAVVGVDFGAASIRAAKAALALLDPAPDGGAQLTLVHARAPLADVPGGADGWVADYEANVGTMFVRLRELLRPFVPDAVTLETRIRTGAVAACLRETAEEIGAALVAVGTRGPGWAERLFLGSVSTDALRHAGRSVLVAPAPGAAERVRLELRVAGRVDLDHAEDWAGALDTLTRRNAGRRVRLEVGGHDAGGCVVEAERYRFLGAAYDPHDRRVEIMLGEDADPARHLTHGVTHVRAVEIVAESERRDHALLVEDARGETVLTFLD